MVNTFENCCIDGDTVYFFSYEMNGLFRIEMKKNECHFIKSFHIECQSTERLFGDITLVENKLILAPMAASQIVIFDLSDQTEHLIKVPEPELEYIKDDCKFYAAIANGKFAYLIAHGFPAILKINVETYAISMITDWCAAFRDHIKDGCDLFRNNYCIIEKKILVACCQKNAVLEIDMETDTTRFIEVGSAQRRYSGIVFDGKYYWLSPFLDHTVVKWEYQSGEWSEFELYDHNDEDLIYNMRYSQEFNIGKYVVLLPLYAYSTCIINTENNEIDLIDSDWILKNCRFPVAPLRGGFIYEGNLYVACSIDGILYQLDVESKKYRKTDLRLFSFQDFNNGSSDGPKICMDQFIYENYGECLEKLCVSLRWEKKEQISENCKKNVGIDIYNELKGKR